MISNIEQKKVGLQIHPGKTKDSQHTRKEMEIDNIKVEILTREESTTCLGQLVTFQQQGDNRDQESNQGCLGDDLQIQTRADLEILPPSTPASIIRHGDRPIDELRLRNLDTLKRT